jgi:hypothetical protein
VKALSPSDPPAAPAEPVAPPPPAAPEPVVPPVAEWPRWTEAADRLLVLLVVGLAFLVASHAARNSDVWPHFAAGRALLDGSYSLGTDPFAYTTAGRAWVNHSWLYDLAVYGLFRADPTGGAAVAAKAVAFAGAFAVLFFLRPPGRPLWPWAACGAVGALAAAPHSGLRPLVLSALFLAVTLVILFRVRWRPGGWRNSLLLAGLFWVWASFDAWFVLGPAAVALTLLGVWLQRRFPKAEPDAAGPAVPDLAKALVVGLAACSLTPHHVRVWQVPPELAGLPAAVRSDPLFLSAALSPRSPVYVENAGVGRNANGLAYGVLLLAGGAVVLVVLGVMLLGSDDRLAAVLRGLGLPLVCVWFPVAYLTLVHYRLILFLAVVSVPLVARAVGELAGRVRLGRADSPATRVTLIGAGVGRVIGVAAAALLCASAYPGWLHPRPADPAYANRVAWRVDPDPGLARAAAQLQRWRDEGRTPDAFRGLHLSAPLGDYLTWFAPKEKAFVTTRYALHADVLEDFARGTRLLQPRDADTLDPGAIDELCRKYDAAYLAYAGATSPPGPLPPGPLGLSGPGGGFALWHADGRAAVLGRLSARPADPAAFDRLAFDPVRLAFDPAQPPAAEPPLPTAPPGDREWLQDFLDSPRPDPVSAYDAMIWYDLAQGGYSLQVNRVLPAAAGLAGPLPLVVTGQRGQFLPSPVDEPVAYLLLAGRAARRAVAENPDSPLGYRAVLQVFAAGAVAPSPLVIPGSPPGEGQQQFVAAARAFLDRVPPPPSARPDAAQSFAGTADGLARLYRPLGFLDLAREAELKAAAYWKRAAMAGQTAANADQITKEIDANLQPGKAQLTAANDRFEREAQGRPDLRGKMEAAVRNGLGKRAIELYHEADPKALGPNPADLTALAAFLEIRAGLLPQAVATLNRLKEEADAAAADGRADPQTLARLRGQLETGVLGVAEAVGDYARIGQAMEANAAARPRPTDAQRALIAAAAAGPDAWNAVRGGVPGVIAGVPGMMAAGGAAQPTLGDWVAAADFFVGRGRVLVLEGRIGEAKARFEQALRPDGVPLPAFLPQRQTAEQYLRMIDHAERATRLGGPNR